MKCPQCGSFDTKFVQTGIIMCECCGRNTNVPVFRIGKLTKEYYGANIMKTFSEYDRMSTFDRIVIVAKGVIIGKAAVIVSNLIREGCVYEGCLMDFEVGRSDGKCVPVIEMLVGMPKK